MMPWRAWEDLGSVLYQFSITHCGGYTMLITNLWQLYSEQVDAAACFERLLELNPSLEATSEQMTQFLTGAVGGTGAVWTGDVISLSNRQSGVTLRWEFRLCLQTGGELAARLVRPILTALGQVHVQQDRLLEEVAARDRELDDYRRSGATLTLRGLRTQPLDGASFEAEMKARGLGPAVLVHPSSWEMILQQSEVETSDAEPQQQASEAVPPQPREDVEKMAARRRRELEDSLQEQTTHILNEKKRKRLNL